jgi:hypothetical protein
LLRVADLRATGVAADLQPCGQGQMFVTDVVEKGADGLRLRVGEALSRGRQLRVLAEQPRLFEPQGMASSRLATIPDSFAG